MARKQNSKYLIWKGGIKLPLLANNTRIYVENLMKFIEKILELISKFSEAAEYSINLQKSTV